MLKTSRHHRTKLYSGLRHYHAQRNSLLLSAGLLVSLPLFADSSANRTEWECRAGTDGSWVCGQQTVPGRAYDRPVHPEAEPSIDDEGPQVRLSRNLDWVDKKSLSDEEKKRQNPGCCGAYIEPERNYPDSNLDPEEASMRVAATSTEVAQEGIAHLNGNVQLTQGYRQVRSDHARVDQTNRIVDLEGNVQFREPGMLLTGDTAHIDMDTQGVQIDNVSYVLHESGIRGTADRLTREGEEIFYIDNALYTSCEPGSNAWQLNVAKLDINPETGIAHAKHVRLEVKEVPVFYLPWLRFPTDDSRASGLLYPSWEISDENGLDFAQPIYLNLAPNYDATITPRYIQERGTMGELELRHLSRWSNTVVSGAFLSSDDGGDDTDEPADPITGLKPHEGEDRWVGAIEHTGGIGHRWQTEIDYTKVSDSDYFRDLGNATLEVSSRTHLRQKVAASYRTDNWLFGVQGQEFQTIIENQPDQYQLKPRATANGNYRLGDFELALKNQFTSFDHTDPTLVTGDRVRADYGITWDKAWAWGYFRPTLKTKYLSYDLDENSASLVNNSPSVTVPVGIIDTGIFMERDTSLLSGFLQTFEPRLYYVHSEFEDQSELPDFDTADMTFSYQQLFRDDRFTGGDRIGDTEQVSVGLTTRLIKESTGVEWLRASIGQIFYLDERFVSLNSTLTEDFLKSLDDPETLDDLNLRSQATDLLRDESAYAAELHARLGNNWRAQFDLLYDEDDGVIDKGSFNLRYHNRASQVFNLGYRYTRSIPLMPGLPEEVDTDLEQSDVSGVVPIFGNWSLIARWNYDLTNSRELETFAGLEYNNCCWRASIVARRWIDRNDNLADSDLEEDEGIFFQIQLKGLAGTGPRVDSIISDGIYGYQPQQ